MNPDNEASLAALDGLSRTMRRGRFMDALPEEEQRQITLILSPDGGVQVVSDSGAGDGGVMPDEMEDEEIATGQEPTDPALDEVEAL